MISIIFSSSPFTIIVIIIIIAVKYLIISKRIRKLSVSKVTLSIVTEAQWGQSTCVEEIIPMMELLKINHRRTLVQDQLGQTFTEKEINQSCGYQSVSL